MRLIIFFVASYFVMIGAAYAQPSSASGVCQFREQHSGWLGCRATFEFKGFQSDSPTNLSVECQGLRKNDVFIFSDSAELTSQQDQTIIEPKGPRHFPAISIPNTSFSCAPPIPRTVDATLFLDTKVLRGECIVAPVCSH